MKKTGLLFLSFLFIIGLTNGQSDFRSGYIIMTNGDSLAGEIDYRGDYLMREICKFKTKENDKEIKYTPYDIKAYRFFDSKFYVSKEVNNKKVFLEFLINAKVKIYYLRDEKGAHYFIENDSLSLEEIPYHEEMINKNNVNYFYRSKKHIGFLNLYMQDAPDFQKRIAQIRKPDHQNLIKLTEEYHNKVCKDRTCTIYEKKLPFIKLSVEPIWGLIRYKEPNKTINEIGCNLYFWAPRTSEKLYVKTGATYHKLTIVETVEIYKIPLQIQYLYPSKKFQPKISLGINLINIKLKDFISTEHSFSLNAGFNYKIYKALSLSTSFNSDFSPLSLHLMTDDLKFRMFSNSLNFGLYIEI